MERDMFNSKHRMKNVVIKSEGSFTKRDNEGRRWKDDDVWDI